MTLAVAEALNPNKPKHPWTAISQKSMGQIVWNEDQVWFEDYARQIDFRYRYFW